MELNTNFDPSLNWLTKAVAKIVEVEHINGGVKLKAEWETYFQYLVLPYEFSHILLCFTKLQIVEELLNKQINVCIAPNGRGIVGIQNASFHNTWILWDDNQ